MKTAEKPRKPGPRVSAAVRLRDEIARAEAQGVSRDVMILHLTHSDVSALTKDRSLPVEDISFAGGKMRYLGVQIEQGGVSESVLRLPDAT